MYKGKWFFHCSAYWRVWCITKLLYRCIYL